MLNDMVVAIVSGSEGTGKTTQLLGIAEAFPSTMWGIMELKDEEKIMALKTNKFTPEVLYRIYPDDHELEGNEDPKKTLNAVEEWRDSIFKSELRPRTVIFDGISDLREYAIDAWIIANNAERAAKGRAPLKGIGEKNLSGWSEVNNTVKLILKPLINLALKNHINFIMTAQMKDMYRDGVIVGIEPAIKPYMSYPVPCLFTLSYSALGYTLECTKESENPRWNIENLRKKTGMLEALRAHNLLIAPTREKDFMVTYEYELGGEKKRTFMKAETAVDAEAEFLRSFPACKVLEVME